MTLSAEMCRNSWLLDVNSLCTCLSENKILELLNIEQPAKFRTVFSDGCEQRTDTSNRDGLFIYIVTYNMLRLEFEYGASYLWRHNCDVSSELQRSTNPWRHKPWQITTCTNMFLTKGITFCIVRVSYSCWIKNMRSVVSIDDLVVLLFYYFVSLVNQKQLTKY